MFLSPNKKADSDVIAALKGLRGTPSVLDSVASATLHNTQKDGIVSPAQVLRRKSFGSFGDYHKKG